jgi:hypothetical protein
MGWALSKDPHELVMILYCYNVLHLISDTNNYKYELVSNDTHYLLELVAFFSWCMGAVEERRNILSSSDIYSSR